MIKDFFSEIIKCYPEEAKLMLGYDNVELTKIERLYGINISGEFRLFMSRAGRCDGGLIGDDPIILYRPSWPVRAHILFQVDFFNSLQEIGAWQYLNKPFVISLESETQYFYLRTGEANSDLIYHYDENKKIVKCTNFTLFEYLLDVIKRYPKKGIVCRGDLLNI